MIKTFEGYSNINENVTAAKELLLKLASKKSRRSSPEGKVKFTPEEEKKILSNPDYIELRDYLLNVVKKPGLVYPFTYFMFVEKLPRYSQKDSEGNYDEREFCVENLINLYLQAAPNFSIFPLPLGNIDNYIRDKELKKSTIPAYEVLFSDLENIISMKGLKGFVDKIQSKDVRDEFKKSVQLRDKDPESKELLDKLYSSYTAFKNLSPKIDSAGKSHTPESTLIAGSKKYLDLYNNYKFENPRQRFVLFVNDCVEKLEGWESGIEEFLIEIENIAPSIKLLYSDNATKVVVTSSRSFEGIKEVCKVSNADLCIASKGNFFSITGGCLQISINMMDLTKLDLKYLTTFTVRKDGTIKEARTRVNMAAPQPSKSNENYKAFISRYLPEIDHEGVIQSIERSFGSELTIKNLIQTLEQKASSSDSKSLVLLLGSLEVQKSIEKGDYTREEMLQYRDLIIAILKKDNKISYDSIVSDFKSPGGLFMSKSDIDLFKIITEGNYKKEDALNIINLTKLGIDDLMDFLNQVGSTEDSNTITLVKHLIDSSPEVIEYAERILL
jgi:hypothetical protein